MKVAFNRGHLKHLSGDIESLPVGDFANLFNVVMFEKGRREMEGLSFCDYTLDWTVTMEGKFNGKKVEPTTVNFKKRSVRQHFSA